MLYSLFISATLITIFAPLRESSNFYTDVLSMLKFKFGDYVVTPASDKYESVTPYHWMFAISDTEVTGVFGRPYFNSYAHIYIIPKESNVGHWRAKRVPRNPKRPNMSLKGAILARRLNGQKVYYDLLRCNCRHYARYFAYGSVFGSIKKISGLPINKSCPLHRVIDEDTDVRSANFTLKDGYGVEHDILLPYKTNMEPNVRVPLRAYLNPKLTKLVIKKWWQ
nr:PREDICTED: uncharacterized protein LOC109037556 [Bemisia tabaci]